MTSQLSGLCRLKRRKRLVSSLEVFVDRKLATIVHTVRDGGKPLAYLQCKGKYKGARVPDGLLPNINMPRMNGYEVLESMKKEPRLQSLPSFRSSTSAPNACERDGRTW